MKRLFFAIAILPWIFIACTTVTFEEPQPAGEAHLGEIPVSLLGHYYDYDNQTDLYITAQLIVGKRVSKDTLNIKELKNGEGLAGDSLYIPFTKEKYKINRINDSLISDYCHTDTIFYIKNETDVLKADGNDFFLNTKIADNHWIVSRLAFRSGVINISNIETENQMKIMEAITNTKPDTSNRLVAKPTREQFRKFVEQSGFTNGYTYLRVDSLHNPSL